MALYQPTKVIFVDNLLENLEHVEVVMQSMGIPHKGYHYLGAERFFKPLNEKLIRHQFSHLLATGEWLADREVAGSCLY